MFYVFLAAPDCKIPRTSCCSTLQLGSTQHLNFHLLWPHQYYICHWEGKSTHDDEAFWNTQQVKKVLKLGVKTTLSFHSLCLPHSPLPPPSLFWNTVFWFSFAGSFDESHTMFLQAFHLVQAQMKQAMFNTATQEHYHIHPPSQWKGSDQYWLFHRNFSKCEEKTVGVMQYGSNTVNQWRETIKICKN